MAIPYSKDHHIDRLRRCTGVARITLSNWLARQNLDCTVTFEAPTAAAACRSRIYALRKLILSALHAYPEISHEIIWLHNLPADRILSLLDDLCLTIPEPHTLQLRARSLSSPTASYTITHTAPNASHPPRVAASHPRQGPDSASSQPILKEPPKNEPIDDNQLAIEELQWQISKLEREHRNLALYVDRPDPLGLIPESDKTRFFDLQNELTNLRASLAALQEGAQQ